MNEKMNKMIRLNENFEYSKLSLAKTNRSREKSDTIS